MWSASGIKCLQSTSAMTSLLRMGLIFESSRKTRCLLTTQYVDGLQLKRASFPCLAQCSTCLVLPMLRTTSFAFRFAKTQRTSMSLRKRSQTTQLDWFFLMHLQLINIHNSFPDYPSFKINQSFSSFKLLHLSHQPYSHHQANQKVPCVSTPHYPLSLFQAFLDFSLGFG